MKTFGSLESVPFAAQPCALLSINLTGVVARRSLMHRAIHLPASHATHYERVSAHVDETCDAYISCLNTVPGAVK